MRPPKASAVFEGAPTHKRFVIFSPSGHSLQFIVQPGYHVQITNGVVAQEPNCLVGVPRLLILLIDLGLPYLLLVLKFGVGRHA